MQIYAGVILLSARRHHRRHHHRHTARHDANGNVASAIVTSQKTGAKAVVGEKYAAQFQAYIDDLEFNGATLKDIGGNRRGHCSNRHMHSCGKALDVCQLRRGVVRSDCDLPSKTIMARIAADHGLFEGGLWCDSDYGHAQVGVSAPACGSGTTMMARRHTHERRHYATRRHHHRRVYAQQQYGFGYQQAAWRN
jgi:hypothetical protein